MDNLMFFLVINFEIIMMTNSSHHHCEYRNLKRHFYANLLWIPQSFNVLFREKIWNFCYFYHYVIWIYFQCSFEKKHIHCYHQRRQWRMMIIFLSLSLSSLTIDQHVFIIMIFFLLLSLECLYIVWFRII